jgi:DNA modification methylase
MLFFRKSKGNINNKVKGFFPDVLNIELDKVSGYKSKDSFATPLIELIVNNYTNAGDLVLDPFIGTGKTACVCKSLGREYIGFELNQAFVDIAKQRVGLVS